MPTHLGRHSPRIPEVARLRDARERRARRRFAFEGPSLLEEALRSDLRVHEFYATPEAYEAHKPELERLEASGVPVYLVDGPAFARISDLETPTGLLGVAETRLHELDDLMGEDGLVLLLAAVNDPGNAGTLVRTADAFGVGAIVVGAGGVDPFHPKVVRAAMGSLFRARLAVASAPELEAAARESRRPVVAADRSGSPLPSVNIPSRAILAVGNERRGALAWLERADAVVSIPQIGEAESLNAAVAGSILLYAATTGRINATS